MTTDKTKTIEQKLEKRAFEEFKKNTCHRDILHSPRDIPNEILASRWLWFCDGYFAAAKNEKKEAKKP